MATHSSTLAWTILWMEEPGGLQSMGSQRVGHRVTKQLVATLVAQTVKTPPAMQETRVQSLGWEDPQRRE